MSENKRIHTDRIQQWMIHYVKNEWTELCGFHQPFLLPSKTNLCVFINAADSCFLTLLKL